MPKFDQTMIDQVMERLGKIDDDAKPLWGSMSAPQMRAHLVTAVRYSLGKEAESPDESTLLTKWVLVPLLLSGLLKLPKNVARPKLYDASAPSATGEELKTEMQEFLTQLQSGSFNPPIHPTLGNLGPQGWARLHNVHTNHHLRQFGV